MNKQVFRSWIALLAAVSISSAAIAAEAASLQSQVDSLLARAYKSDKPAMGVCAIDLASGKTILDFRSSQSFAPASNMKVLTSAFALASLGGDFKFTTKVFMAGKDIVVFGDGDPALGDPLLSQSDGKSIYSEIDRWAASIKKATGGKVAGDIIVTSNFALTSLRHSHWPKNQLDCWYAAPVAGLNFNNNCFDVTITQTKPEIACSVEPQSRLIQIVNELKLGPKHTWALHNNEDDSILRLSGSVNASSTQPCSVASNNPPLIVGRVLAERLMQAGVQFTGTVREAKAADVDLKQAQLVETTTTPLAVAVSRANKRSLNMVAECLFLRAGDGTWEGSSPKMIKTLASHYGVQAEQLYVCDGSGLCRNDRVSPAALAQILAAVLKRPDGVILVESLPIGGVDGTLEKRLKAPPCKGRVLGKTGYISGVWALSGYVLDKSGKPAVAYSILINQAPIAASKMSSKSIEDTIARMIVNYVDAGNGPAASIPEVTRSR